MQGLTKLRRLTRVLRSATNQELMLHQFDILLLIAEAGNEPVSFAEIGSIMQLSRAAISRNMKLLGQRMEKVGEKWNDTGYGLIDVVPYPYDTRGYAAMLSTKGKQLIKQLEQIVGGQDDNQTG